MAKSKYFDISMDERSLQRLFSLEKAMNQFPNRVKYAIEAGAKKGKKEVHRTLNQNYRSSKLGRDSVIKITTSATANKGTFKMEVLRANPSRGANQRDITKARFDANIKLRGRKSYVASRSDKPYDLRNWSKPKDAAQTIKVRAIPANPSFQRFLTYRARQIFSESVKEALAQQGIGSRGGISRIRGGDVPR